MTPNHDFTNAKVGDKIYTARHGEGTIVQIEKSNYPIITVFNDGIKTFTIDGKINNSDTEPTAFTESIKVVPASYEPFVEQEMMVWDGENITTACQRVVFANSRGKFIAYTNTETIQCIDGRESVFIWDNALPIAEWEAKVKEIKNQKEITEIEFQIAELQAKLEKLKG